MTLCVSRGNENIEEGVVIVIQNDLWWSYVLVQAGEREARMW